MIARTVLYARTIWLAVSITVMALSKHAEAAPITDFVIYGKEYVQIGIGSTVTGLVGSGTTVVGMALLGGKTGVFGGGRRGDGVPFNQKSLLTGTIADPTTF